MAIQDLKEQISRLPEQPGVYLYGNAAGETIYVGKARALRDRVRSYLAARGSSPKTDALLDEVAALEVIVTDSVVEALALENNLIKQRAPRYNILLRDDKSYPYLRLTLSEAFPRVLVARQVARDGDLYAGPFLPASLARRTIGLGHKLFGLRSCNEVITGKRARPCLEYDIKRCLAPCVDTVCSPERYQRAVDDMRLLLEGRVDELAADLEARMRAAAGAERFEEAAQQRDAMRVVQAVGARQQKMATPALGDRDVFGVAVGPAGAVIQVFQVRRGRVVERVTLQGVEGDAAESAGALVAAALQQFYEEHEPPREVDLPVDIDDADMTEAWLSSRAGRRVSLLVPQRGDRRRLVDLAVRNAEVAVRGAAAPGGDAFAALDGLRQALSLAGLPRRIECFDISTLQGSETVASLVVCEDGRMAKGEYRKFRVKGAGNGASETEGSGRFLNDFAAMAQVVHRRFSRLVEAGGPFPDLLVIDGGRGQLDAAYGALERLGLANLVAVGLAKREELVVTRDADTPVAFERTSPALRLLQQIRDEAHRFAVTFHRTARSQRDFGSDLDTIPGVGPRRRRQLLTRFGSLAGVRRATREDLVPVVGQRCADAVLTHFARGLPSH
ncbi:MAG: excinuclease ABC subunit UvrC [Acidobacteria bacterium]|nr:excinuclease ABC subunit UvrC [Acidobacteriota bacterium]